MDISYYQKIIKQIITIVCILALNIVVISNENIVLLANYKWCFSIFSLTNKYKGDTINILIKLYSIIKEKILKQLNRFEKYEIIAISQVR